MRTKQQLLNDRSDIACPAFRMRPQEARRLKILAVFIAAVMAATVISGILGL